VKQYLYIANWKMNMPLLRACSFYSDNQCELEQIAALPDVSLILCPSYIAIAPLQKLLQTDSALRLGAQNCAAYSQGAYTGEVDALSLKQAGCIYCIVGHSERRTLYGETNQIVADKVVQLYKPDIIPIVCIGETKEEQLQDATYDVLAAQLAPIFAHTAGKSIIVAYEPMWAIGTGNTPSLDTLSVIFAWLFKHITTTSSANAVSLVYGGSVDTNSILMLKKVPHINGFLIGGASCDFNTLKNIVVSP
jgi:triosephosphate isomerase (TIM)